jgi:hypothetical protein
MGITKEEEDFVVVVQATVPKGNSIRDNFKDGNLY